MMKKFINREGFWHNKEEPQLPKPRQGKSAWKGQEKFLQRLREVEDAHPSISCKSYKGASTCRLCGERNGSEEYTLSIPGATWSWPSGYSHYVKDHNVRPSLAFQEFIEVAHKDL